MTTEQYSIGYNAGYQDGFDAALAEPVKQEPVAYVYEKDVAGIGMRKDVAFTKHVEIGTDLYAAPVDAKAIRAEALAEPVNQELNWGANKFMPHEQPVKQEPVAIESAEKMGATGAAPTESERQLFEAWMRGHCWAISGVWDGKTYVDSAETGGYINPLTMHVRCLWAAWRDRAALGAPVDAKAIRAEALEEAAKWLKESGLIGSNDCADAIRGLK